MTTEPMTAPDARALLDELEKLRGAVPDPADVEKAARAMTEALDRLGLDGMAEWEDLLDTAEAVLLPALAAVRPSPDSEALARARPCVVCGYDEAEHRGGGEMLHDFRPAGPVAEAGDELRAEIRNALAGRLTPRSGMADRAVDRLADDILALPALRGLVEQAAEAARLRAVVARVEALAERYEATSKRRRQLAEKWQEAARWQLADAFRNLARQSDVAADRIRAALGSDRLEQEAKP